MGLTLDKKLFNYINSHDAQLELIDIYHRFVGVYYTPDRINDELKTLISEEKIKINSSKRYQIIK